MKRNLSIIIACLTVAVLASSACADFMSYGGQGFKSAVTLHADGYLADGRRVYAGQNTLDYEGFTYDGYCVDIDHWVGSSEVVERPYTWLNNGDLVAYLYETYAPTVDSNTTAAALSVSIWEVLFETENAYDPSSGAFSVSTSNGGVFTEAEAMLQTLPPAYAPVGEVIVLDSPDKQDMVVGHATKVPEPSTAILLAMGSLLWLRRRRRTA